MNGPKDGGPAFPHHGGYPNDDPRNQIIGGGMTLRDYFAGIALGYASLSGWSHNAEEFIATRAYKMADAMIAAREQVK